MLCKLLLNWNEIRPGAKGKPPIVRYLASLTITVGFSQPAHTHNLKNIDIDIPRNQLVVTRVP